MANEFSAMDIIDDLRKFGRGEWDPEDIPIEVVRYLLLNYFPIEMYLSMVFTHFSAPKRKELALEHRELDDSVVYDNFQPIAFSALHKLKSYYLLKSRITKDDLNMLIRALEYAKYITIEIPNLFRDP